MGIPSPNQLFTANHQGVDNPDDPSLFTASELVAGILDSSAVSTATSAAVSTVNAAAPDSTSISQARSQAVSAASVGSAADSKAVSVSATTSVADSKALSGSVNTSIADSKAVSGAAYAQVLSVRAGGALYATLVGETGVFDTSYNYGDVRRYGAQGLTDDTAAVQAAINALSTAPYPVLQFAQGKTYQLHALTIGVANLVIDIPKGTTLQFASLGSGANAFTITVNDVTFRGRGKILGPNASVYTADERGISMIGTSSLSRASGLTIDGPEITGFGGHGVYCQYVDRVRIPEAYIHDCGYAGAMFLSCDHGRIGHRVRVETITPGTASNMYGISLTHDSTNYSSDGNAGTQQAANPFCADWVIDGAYVNDINWEGIDCHGGYDVAIINNKVYNTKLGISCPTGSNAAANYAGWKNRVQGNTIDGRKPDGTVSGRENTGYAINVNGGSTVQHTNIIVADNIITAKGTASQSATGVINAQQLRGGVIRHNTLRSWGGIGIQIDNSDGTEIVDNVFQEIVASDSVGRCIVYTGTTGIFTIKGNRADANGGTIAKVGFAAVNMTARAVLSDNDFKSCSTGEGLFLTSPPALRGTDYPRTIIMSAASTSIDVTSLADGPEIVIVVNVSSGGFTLDTITGAKSGQLITIVNIGTSSVTLSRSSSALFGSTTAVIPQKSTVRLVRVSTTNYEISRSLTNG